MIIALRLELGLKQLKRFSLRSSYFALRSEPKSFDIEFLEGSPEIFTFPLAFVSTSVYCNVLYCQALETTT